MPLGRRAVLSEILEAAGAPVQLGDGRDRLPAGLLMGLTSTAWGVNGRRVLSPSGNEHGRAVG
jgi:hypothetical protein